MSDSTAPVPAAATVAFSRNCNDPLEVFCENCNNCNVGSLYCLPYLQELFAGGYWRYLNLRRILPTLENYNWSDENVVEAVTQMTSRNFQKIVPNCKFEEEPGPAFVDADQYSIFYDGAYISLKLALVEEDGELGGLITFHSS